jgi:hypothetical protein
MNNVDKDETVVVRCPTDGCDEIMGRNGDGNPVCTSCSRVVVEVHTHGFGPKLPLQDSQWVLTPAELELAIHDAALEIYVGPRGTDVAKYADQISACVAEQKRRGLI